MVLVLSISYIYSFTHTYLIKSDLTLFKNSEVNPILLADSPFSIYGNDELNDTADYGNGTIINPYVIENKTIYGGGIGIYSTDMFLIIRNCTISNGGMGILFLNVSNAIITENLLYGHDNAGIWLQTNSENNSIFKNKCYNNLWGITISTSSSYNNLTHNEFNDNTIGIQIQSADHNRIYDNLIQNNSVLGINLYTANYNYIAYNKLYYNAHSITEINCDGNIIENNDIIENENPAISGYHLVFLFLGIIIVTWFFIILNNKFPIVLIKH